MAFVFDAYSRAIVGWTTAATKTTSLVSKALNMAVWRRDHYGHPIEPGLIHHSDAGARYTSVKFVESLALQELSASIGSVGGACDPKKSPRKRRPTTETHAIRFGQVPPKA
ncbi:hypothetical protein Ntsu_40740 [Nocardia sp. IFM 10818]